MVVMRKGSVVKKPSPTMRLINMDVESDVHQNSVLVLAKNWHYRELFQKLKNKVPPNHGLDAMQLVIMEMWLQTRKKESDENWSLHGLLAVDTTKTTQNKHGVDKVVGFSLYIINKKNKNQLQVLFLFVNKHYRKNGHATNMMKTVQDRHLGTVEWGEKFTGRTQSVLGYDLVSFILIEVLVGAAEILFYKTLGFAIASEVPGWDDKVGMPTCSEYIIMVDASPLIWEIVLKRGMLRDSARKPL